MSNKRILFISPLPPPYYGSAMSSHTCLKVLQNSNKYTVRNIKANYSRNFSDIEKLSLRKIAGYFIVLFRIIYHLLKYKPDLVYIMPATSGFAFIRDFSYSLVLKAFNQNIVYHLRTQITDKERNNKLKNFIFHKALKKSNIIVLGKEMESNIQAYLNQAATHILPNTISNSIDEQEFIEIENKRKNTENLRLVFISNMIRSKGWAKTIESADILNKQNIDFTLNFAGSWPSAREEKEFVKLVEEFQLQDKINHLGHIDKQQKKKVLSGSDVMVFPTEYPYEALPRVIIEAYEYGIPVVSTQNGSIPSMIIHGQTGYLLESYTAGEIAEYLVKLSDRKKLIEMGKNARNRFSSTYEISVFSKNFKEIIDKCI